MANLTVHLLKVANLRTVDRHLSYPGKLRRPWRVADGNAAWAWKPAVIHAALQRAKPGDFVVRWCRLNLSNPR